MPASLAKAGEGRLAVGPRSFAAPVAALTRLWRQFFTPIRMFGSRFRVSPHLVDGMGAVAAKIASEIMAYFNQNGQSPENSQ
ncbi:MAG: hypothetical protein J7639_09810 [Paenibacillaceae bacterium]|nr:hypothetical protein [Paenibacillaceae bacterium]